MPLSRRELLKLGLLAAPGAALGRYAEAQVGDPGSPPVIPFTRQLRIPPNITPSGGGGPNVTLTMSESTQAIVPGRPDTPIWGYNGQYPGPTIRARRNQSIVVRQINNLPESTSVHLHGGHTGPTSDGHPNDLITPGNQKDYTYPNSQLPATLWYHDHAVDVTGPHLYMGLAGMYIIGETFEDNLNLPGGPLDDVNLDVPLFLSDRLFNRDGSFAYPLTDEALIRGALGDRIMVNGVIQPNFRVPSRKVRFRVVNASNARIYDLRLTNGAPFIQLGSDGALLPAPLSRTSLRLAPAERADVVIDFTGMTIGTMVVMRNVSRSVPLSMDRAPREIMRFEVDRTQADTSVIPPALRPITPLGAAAQTRVANLTRGVVNGRPVWFINGKLYNPGQSEFTMVAQGSTELWQFNNNSPQDHPMHIHLVQFQVQNPGVGENGWKDTVLVPSGATVSVKAQFTGTAGTYVFHCHNVEHEDHAMMNQFELMA